jgi:hypothetical protein
MSRTKRCTHLRHTGFAYYFYDSIQEFNEKVEYYRRDGKWRDGTSKHFKRHCRKLRRSNWKEQLAVLRKCSDYEDVDTYNPKKLEKKLIWTYW